MKTTLSALILSLMLCSGAYAAVEPVITVNGTRGTVNFIGINGAVNPAVTVNIRVSPGEKEGADADCWLVGNAFGRWYYYTRDAQWTDIGETLDIARLRPVYQGRLVALPQTDILHLPQLTAGIYTLYFGIDLNMNGKLDADSLVFDVIKVNVMSDAVSGGYSGSSTAGYSDTSSTVNGYSASFPTSSYYDLPAPAPEDRQEPPIRSLNITDFIPLDNGYGIQVTGRGDKHTLRAVPLSDPENGQPVSELVLDEHFYSGAFANGSLIYLVFSVPETIESDFLFAMISIKEKSTEIQVIDFSTPQSPVKRGSIKLAGNYYPPNPAKVSVPILNWGLIFQMSGSVLILPYAKGEVSQKTPSVDLLAIIRDAEQTLYNAEKGVRVLDFSDPDHPKEISDLHLDVRGVSGYFMNGRTLYVSHYTTAEDMRKSYYLSRVGLSDPAKPLQSASVGIPAPCIGTDSSGTYAFTMDYANKKFSSVKLEADKTYLSDEITFNDFVGGAMISDGIVYLSGNSMAIVDVSNPENLKPYEYRLKDGNAAFIGAKNRKFFASIAVPDPDKPFENIYAGMACYDASNIESLGLNEFKAKFVYVTRRIAFSGDKAYLPMGYYGLWVKSLGN
jgi:hypothetical protein